jgi:UDP-3-O-[3-hydroxymyristoyl] glucosamine N-acyltransferase
LGIKLAELAVRYGCELHGDPDQVVECVGTLQSAGAGSVSFLANRAYRKHLSMTQASAVILAADAVQECPVACLVADDPYGVFASVAADLHPPLALVPGVHSTAAISPSAIVPATCEIAAGVCIGANAQLGERVYVGPNTVIGADVRIGADCRLLANVTCYQDIRMGNRCIVHSGAVVGADGFGIAQTPTGWRKVPQVGRVKIGDDVEIGAGSTIDRGAIEDTEIGFGVKIDNLVHIAHNVHIGDHTVIAAQSGIAGSTRVGARCMLGGHVAVSGHLEICDDVYLLGRASVTRSINSPGTYSSVIGVEEAGKWRKLAARFKRLEEMAAKLKSLDRNSKNEQDRGS